MFTTICRSYGANADFSRSDIYKDVARTEQALGVMPERHD
jgi:hypothetical protein